MPGKNQTKRQIKDHQHARLVWTRKAIASAAAWRKVKDAVAFLEEHRSELTEEDLQTIHAQAESQFAIISDHLIKATEVLTQKVGDEDASHIISGFIPESALEEDFAEVAGA